MKAFKFRFETLQKVRRLHKEQQAKKLGLAGQAVATAKKEKEDMILSLNGEVARQRALAEQGEFFGQLYYLSMHMRTYLRKAIKDKDVEIANLTAKFEQERRLLIEKQKAEAVLTKLREKEKLKYEDELRKGEINEMDEAAGRLFYQRVPSN